VAGQHSDKRPGGESPAGRLAIAVSTQQASLLAKLHEELGNSDPEAFAAAAERLAVEYGPVTAAAVDAVLGRPADAAVEKPVDLPLKKLTDVAETEAVAVDEQTELASLYRPGQMRRRLEQLTETNRRYGHPFALAIFDASGPDLREGGEGGGREAVMAIVGVALRDSIRIVDEAFRLEEDAICVLAPNLHTVEGVQMAERLLRQLDELERAGGWRIAVAAGVVACPEHGTDVDELLQKADAALWRARAVGQPVGVGALEPVQDR
jgi:diguanylate cyclase (GGDEF)-like protein